MDDNALISVIVPVYNVENYLYKCISSIITQSYGNFELILIDDGSIDKSGEICDSFSEKDNRIKVIHKVNEGVSSARNYGLKQARGEYICFVDSDDYVLTYIIHSGFISGYQNRYGDNLKPPTNVYHRMTA